MKNIKISALTDVGMVREENEDNFWHRDYGNIVAATVADGMGGHIGGRAASETAVETIERLFNQNRGRLAVVELIEDCLVLGNRKIREKAAEKFRGMNIGTTCTLAVVSAPEAGRGAAPRGRSGELIVHFGHIGDSKLYLINGDEITQKSTDHTMLQRLLDTDALKPEQAETFSHKNVIYKSLGGTEKLDLDPVEQFPLGWGNILLLCSDGLSNYLKPPEMVYILQGSGNLKRAAEYMVDLAKFRGGDDNITVVLLEYGKYPRKKGVTLENIKKVKRKGSGKKKIVLKISKRDVVILLLAALAILAALLFRLI